MKDKWIRVIGIPFIGIFMPIFFSGKVDPLSSFFYLDILISLFATFVIWEGNRFILIKLRHKLSWEKDPALRLFGQLLLGVLYTIIVVLAIMQLVAPLLYNAKPGSLIINKCILGSVLITLMMNAIYESIYFSRRWKMAIMRTEVLKRQKLMSKFESLKNQVNPHFLFNSLNTLSHLIEDDKAVAIEFVQKMASVYRYVLQSKNTPLVDIEAEIKFVEMYVFLLRKRFIEGLEVEIDPMVKRNKSLIPPLTLQILVENAVKHNIIGRDKPLKIRIFEANGRLIVWNNLQKKSVLEKYAKIGLKNIRERYQYLSEKPIEILQDALTFTVLLPIIKLEEA